MSDFLSGPGTDQLLARIKTMTRLGRDDPTYLRCRFTLEALDDYWGMHLSQVTTTAVQH